MSAIRELAPGERIVAAIEPIQPVLPQKGWNLIEGSTLLATDRRIVYLAPDRLPSGDWLLPLGNAPDAACAIVRAHGEVLDIAAIRPFTYSQVRHVDFDFLVDSNSRHFPHKVQNGISPPVSGWFPAWQMQRFAAQAGLGYAERRVSEVDFSWFKW